MAGSRDLYELIGTLSKSEKRYCTMMLEAGAGRKARCCLRLFEILSGMPEPDEAGVRAAVAGEPFARHLAVTKKHLYEHLLRSLRSFEAHRSKRRVVRGLIDGAEMLLERGLTSQARGRLREARALAERYEHLPELLIIVKMIERLDMQEGFIGQDPEYLRRQRGEVEDILGRISNYWDYLHAWTTLSCILMRNGPVVEDGERGEVEPLRNPFLSLAPPMSLQARRVRLEGMRTYHLLTSRYDLGYEESLEALRFVESFPMEDRMERLNYISLLYNHAIIAMRVGRYANARRAAAKLRALEPRGRLDRIHHARVEFWLRFDLYLLDLDHEAIAGMKEELERIGRMESEGHALQMRIGYTIHLAIAQYANGQAREALGTLHPLINDCRPGFRNDALCMARLFRLMITFDLGDVETLPYLIRSTYRFISKYRGVSRADGIVLRFMRRLTNLPTRRELVEELVRVRAELIAATAELGGRAPLLSWILPWLDAKITGRGYAELAREYHRAMEVVDDPPERRAEREDGSLGETALAA